MLQFYFIIRFQIFISNFKSYTVYISPTIFRMYNYLCISNHHPHIPEQAFSFIPYHSQSPSIRDDFKVGEGKNIRRLLFEGDAVQTYTAYQLQKLKQFQQYLAQNKIKLDSRWNKPWKLRWLLSTNCNHKKCVQDMQKFIEYKDKVVNPPFTDNVAKVLYSGAFYIAGRDCHYRPIIVFNVQKIIQLQMQDDQMMEAQVYFLQYIMKNLLIPGKVQNWIALIDSGKQSLYSMMNSMKKAFIFLSDTYRSRLFACYNVNVTSMIFFIWGIVKKFLEESTIQKINLFQDNIAQPLLQYCNPSQFEVKFGGSAPNIPEAHFWPPNQISKNYFLATHRVQHMPKQYCKNKVSYTTELDEITNTQENKNTELRQNKQLLLIKAMERQFKYAMSNIKSQSTQLEQIIKDYPKLPPPLNYINLITQIKRQTNTNK